MGCFSNDPPEIYVPPPPKLPTAEEIFNEALNFNRENFPLSLEARENALGVLQTPESIQDYFSGFQPTNFEQALASQHFANVLPDVERSIKHNLSLSGIESSPVLARELGRARGDLGVDIGQYLTNVGNARGASALSAQLGIDPNMVIAPFAETGINQGNTQAQLNYGNDLMQAQADFQNALQDYQRKFALGRTIGFFSPAIGSAVGGWEAGLTGGTDLLKTAIPFMGGMGGSGAPGGAGGASVGGSGFGAGRAGRSASLDPNFASDFGSAISVY